MTNCVKRLSETECWGEANRLPSNELWQIAGEILCAGDLQNRARTKPRGYAGDFEMLRKICEHETCSHPLGRAFDRFFQSQAAPEAVRNRTRIVADRLVAALRNSASGRFRAVSVGAGPAIDVELAARQLDVEELRRLDVILLDLDSDALRHAETRLSAVLQPTQVTCHRENLFRLPRLARMQQLLAEADFISCAGLFDYLTDRDVIAMLACFWQHLAARGEAIVFNFAPINPSRAYMEWIGNWYLTYRTVEHTTQLARQAIEDATKIESEQEASEASLFISFTRG